MNKTKIVALLPFKNEEKMLPSFLSNVLSAVDEIVAIDDNSTDNSAEILKKAGAHVYGNDLEVKSGWAELSIREKLLKLGREHGGTHFVVLDADETFTGQFPAVCRKICEQLKPGQKIRMHWLALWKSVDHYRDDNSVWSNSFKDFIFADDGKMEYPKVWMHTPRTPGPTTEENAMVLNSKYGAVLHFQFSNWDTFQIKQCWLRCSEWIRDQGNALAINQKYSITLDDPSAVVTEIPEEWKKNVVFPTISYKHEPNNWRLKQMVGWIEEYGVDFFKPLEIWHVPQLKELMNDVQIITEHPIAYESPDHIVPVGTKNDNSTHFGYIEEVERYFNGKKINTLDIGCAGGQLAVDFHKRGHLSIGIEGSDYGIKHKNYNWPEYHKKVLFTADITKPFHAEKDGERILFDLISAWEVIEHIEWEELDNVFTNILSNLKENGVFIASVNCGPDVREDENKKLHFLHQSVFPEEFWTEHVLNKYKVEKYPFSNRVRVMDNSFYILLRK